MQHVDQTDNRPFLLWNARCKVADLEPQNGAESRVLRRLLRRPDIAPGTVESEPGGDPVAGGEQQQEQAASTTDVHDARTLRNSLQSTGEWRQVGPPALFQSGSTRGRSVQPLNQGALRLRRQWKRFGRL